MAYQTKASPNNAGQPQAASQMAKLSTIRQSLFESVNDLEKRLSPVIPGADDDEPNAPPSPTALDGEILYLDRINNKLQNIISMITL